jgi:hypothetical protein
MVVMFKKNQTIKFIPTRVVSNMFFPQPASRFVPDWYKDTEPYSPEYIDILNKLAPAKDYSTIKRCPPIFDAISSGYIIVTHADLLIKKNNGGLVYNWLENLIDFHNSKQASLHPDKMINSEGLDLEYPKIISPWGIETPKGYSCLFVPPMHRKNIVNIFPGIVDTDCFNVPVNFPFVVSDLNFEGIIPAGTPIAQVIPFKRDEWEMSIEEDEKKIRQLSGQNMLVRSKFSNAYRNYFWQKKQYR